MELLGANSPLNLEDPERKLRTAGAIMPPARVGSSAHIEDSLISPAAQIDGTAIRSVISPGVIIEKGAEVRDSIIQHRCVIRAGAVVDRSILDKEVVVGRGVRVGTGDSGIPNTERPDIVNAGISIIGKRVTLPPGLQVGRNVIVGPGVHEELLDRETLESGASVHPTQMPLHLFV
jgi:glucose-1-phosphate adenylyltransferase